MYRFVASGDIQKQSEANHLILSRTISNVLWPSISGYMQTANDLKPENLTSRGKHVTFEMIDLLLKDPLYKLLAGTSIVRVNLFTTSGITVFSTDQSKGGEVKLNYPPIINASKGFVTTHVKNNKTFRTLSGKMLKNRFVINSYMPVVKVDTGEVDGIFEIYTDATTIYNQIDQSQMKFAFVLASIFFVIYFIVYLILRHLDKIINKNIELAVARDGAKQVHNELEKKVKERTEELAFARDEAMAASSTKSMFLANMSHEIRTPMNAVLGYTQILLRDTAFPKNYRKQVQTIEKAGAHLLNLINDILDLSKIEAGSMELNTQDFDLNELVNDMGDLFEMRCQKRKLAWRLENKIQGPGLVRGDQGKLRQILINFLGNAVKFTDDGEVKLTVSNSGDQYCFEVADTGVGISASELTNVQEPFHQAAAGINKGGTGLGLAISQRQLELLGSELQVESEPGKGSRFYFRLALPDAKAAVQPRTSRDDQLIHLAPGYVVNALVVDDVEANRDILVHMLQTAGITVRTAVNGKGALAKINEHVPDIVFMDIRMPQMNGSEALKRIRTDYAGQSIVCIAVTSFSLLHEMNRYLDEGFDDIIGKPFRFAEIYCRIEKFLSVEFVKENADSESSNDESYHHENEVEMAVDVRNIYLPEDLYNRLRKAAELNALTDIEEIIEELKTINKETGGLALVIENHLSSYDTDSILNVLEDVKYA